MKAEGRKQKADNDSRAHAGHRLNLAILAFCLLPSAFSLPVSAQQPASVTASRPNQAAQTELNAAARVSIDGAVEALQRGALADAERAARAAVVAAPGSPIPHNVLGVVLDRMGRPDAAFAEFNAAIGLDHNFAGAHNNLGRLLAERGRVPEAIAEFERVLKIDPSHVQAHYNLGALYGDSGDFVNSAEHFARARAGAPDDAQLALAFLIRHPQTFAIPKAAQIAHVEENARAGELRLTDEEIRRIDAAFPADPRQSATGSRQ